jgi:hypothetical protein
LPAVAAKPIAAMMGEMMEHSIIAARTYSKNIHNATLLFILIKNV